MSRYYKRIDTGNFEFNLGLNSSTETAFFSAWFELRIFGYGLDFEICTRRKYLFHIYPFYIKPNK
tara:strand:- start:258 stop:452 length:195 start_codon:yes stop_codon:yes gene_type:complete